MQPEIIVDRNNAETIHSNGKNYDVIIVGGGLAGLISAIELSRHHFNVLLFEKKKYPFNKVCGEYVSNEVRSYLRALGFDPFALGASRISSLRISNTSGKNYFIPLDYGGFGLSRFILDHKLAEMAKESGATVVENCRVNDISFSPGEFSVTSTAGIFKSSIVIGGYGKRDMLDKKLTRRFIDKHTHYMGVKYHIRTDYPVDEIGLDNFHGGYCGIVKIEEDKFNLCYLYRRNERSNFQSIDELEEKVLFTNPVIRNYFRNSVFIFDKPEVINEISFDRKSCVDNHIMMCGDSAGLITPLCGNGMAMAIHGAKILSDILKDNLQPGEILSEIKRNSIEQEYIQQWNNAFTRRLYWGRKLQRFSGSSFITSAFLNIVHSMPGVERWLINKTHGKEIA